VALLSWKEREARKVERKIRLDTIRELRARVKAAREQKRTALRFVRHGCRSARRRLRERIKAARLRAREELRAEIAQMRVDARGRCRVRIEKVRALGKTKLQMARVRLAEQRLLNEEIRATGHRLRKAHARRAEERRQESDDEVEGNLPSDMWGVWRAVKGSIRARERMSRTEAFLHWAEENPDEVVVLQNMQNEQATALMIAELEALEAEHYRKAG
jgi:hypothetical protein